MGHEQSLLRKNIFNPLQSSRVWQMISLITTEKGSPPLNPQRRSWAEEPKTTGTLNWSRKKCLSPGRVLADLTPVQVQLTHGGTRCFVRGPIHKRSAHTTSEKLLVYKAQSVIPGPHQHRECSLHAGLCQRLRYSRKKTHEWNVTLDHTQLQEVPWI